MKRPGIQILDIRFIKKNWIDRRLFNYALPPATFTQNLMTMRVIDFI
jgi:hypothetical protein